MNQGPPAYTLYVGIGMAAATVSGAVMVPDQSMHPVFTVEQTEPGLTRLIAQLAATGQPASQIHVAMEATGTYWLRLASRLYPAGFTVSVVNPSQAYHYAQAWLQRAKTDELDT
jgi:transposase